MIYIVLGICVVLVIIGICLVENTNCIDAVIVLFVVSGFVGACFLTALFVTLGCYNSIKSTADSQIKVYEEQNDVIMTQIEPLVEKYLNYEKETYTSLKIDSNTLIAMSMYPELKGNEFVQSQIKIIMDNQKKITDLKLSKAKLNGYKMWLFMGE